MNEAFHFKRKQKTYLFFKRLLDILISFIAILFCTVLIWLPLTIVNIFATKGHPFFVAKRLGKNNKVFNMLKFRTMKFGSPIKPPYEMSESEIKQMETKFGRFLRKTSLDETLQFVNVILGQMSLIGPRPCAASGEEALAKMRDNQNPPSYLVRPGLTGLAQVNMRLDHNVTYKARFDSEYVSNIGFWLDCKLFFRTFTILVRK